MEEASEADLLHEFIVLISEGAMRAQESGNLETVKHNLIKRNKTLSNEYTQDARLSIVPETLTDADSLGLSLTRRRVDSCIPGSPDLVASCNERRKYYDHMHTVLTHAIREAHTCRAQKDRYGELLTFLTYLVHDLKVELGKPCTALASNRHSSPLEFAKSLGLDDIVEIIAAGEKERGREGAEGPSPEVVSKWMGLLAEVLVCDWSDSDKVRSAAQVTEHLQVGSFNNAKASTVEGGVSAILNCAASVCGNNAEDCKEKGQRYHQFEAEDEDDYPLLHYHLKEATEYLQQAEKEGLCVMIHCYAGVNRAATICIGYLVQSLRYPLLKAVRHVHALRPIILHNKTFREQLILLAHEEGLLQ